MTKLLEPQIKVKVLNKLIADGHLCVGDLVINEFTLASYTRRVDLVFGNKSYLYAVEVKSESDTLARLDGQVGKYLEYFDKVIVAAAPKHIPNILRIVPKNVAVWQVDADGITVKQRGKIVSVGSQEKLLHLMKASELVSFARKLGLPVLANKRGAVEGGLKLTPVSTLREAVLLSLKKRFYGSYSLFWKSVGSGIASSDHIALLSPYKYERDMKRDLIRRREKIWAKSGDQEDVSEVSCLGILSQNNGSVFGETPKYIRLLMAA